MTRRLFVAWQDEQSRTWHTIARLTKSDSSYELVFTKGARQLKDLTQVLFGMNMGYRYQFDTLIPLLKNKLPPKSRLDYPAMLRWLNLSQHETEFDLIAKFGLIPGSDSLIIYPEPSVIGGFFELEFFVHGIRYMHRDVMSWCSGTKEEIELFPMLDVCNPFDNDAVALRLRDGGLIIGYVPIFYSPVISNILRDETSRRTCRIEIVRCNDDAPNQLKILCKITADVPINFDPASAEEQQPVDAFIASSLDAAPSTPRSVFYRHSENFPFKTS
ncbi:HIRAN domain-containing protein [Hansschlegelia sp. KR7-227]|uniref:HIRAN domain-containing protein n=1 Tax=Hansschlegelia sp. KR7-227 TaxID=3400914 RepID=UPI003C101927